MTNHEAALMYLDEGYSVIPLKRDKRPAIEWKPYQTTPPTHEEVNAWWRAFPDALVGIVTGKVSGITVIDVEKGGDHTHFPPTYMVRTGRGGVHLYYDYAEVPNMVRAYALTDIRGDGGYVVAPPSKTEFMGKDGKMQGGEYIVVDDAPKMPFPSHLFAQKTTHFDPASLKGVGEGSRNQSAASVAGFLLSKVKPSEYPTAWALLKAWNSLNKPPLEAEELKNVFVSILKREKSKETPTEDIEIVTLKVAAEAAAKENVGRTTTGFDFIDGASRGGFGPGELWVIAAPQGHGKTTLAMEMTLAVAKSGMKSLWLSYELMVDELWDKFKQMGATDEMGGYTTFKPTQGDIGIVEKIIKTAKEKEGVGIVFIDHFGRLGGKIDKYEKGISSNYSAYLGLLAERLKAFSIEHKVCIVLMAHTRKPGKGLKQTTTDIAHTSGLGNEASVVLIIEREVDDFAGEEGEKYTGKMQIRVDKSRWGKEVHKVVRFENGRITPYDWGMNIKPETGF